jgi:hypothetical protein
LRDVHFIYTLPATREFERQWIGMNDQQRRALLTKVVDCVFVRAGREPIEDRVTICRAGTAPPLPRTGAIKARQAKRFTRKPNTVAPRPRHGRPTASSANWPTTSTAKWLGQPLVSSRPPAAADCTSKSSATPESGAGRSTSACR